MPSARITIKVRPGEKPTEVLHDFSRESLGELRDLQTSARHLFAQVESERERKRILGIINTEQQRTQMGTIPYNRLRELLDRKDPLDGPG